MSKWYEDIAPIAGAAIGGYFGGPAGAMVGGSIGGAISGSANAKDARDDQAAINAQNIALQREFAQNGIQWKVADAKAAGIHPLVGLGAQTHQFSANLGTGPRADMSGMGQDIARSITATSTSAERQMQTLNIQGATLDVEGKALDNQIKSSQLEKLRAVGPAFPGNNNFISGQGNSGTAIIEKPLERTASLPGHPESEAGAIPDFGWAKTKTGVVPIPSGDIKNRIEDNIFHEGMHFVRNNIAPNFGGGTTPPLSALPKGAKSWEWSYTAQEYQPYYGPQDRTGMPDRPGFGGNKNPTQRNIRKYR